MGYVLLIAIIIALCIRIAVLTSDRDDAREDAEYQRDLAEYFRKGWFAAIEGGSGRGGGGAGERIEPDLQHAE